MRSFALFSIPALLLLGACDGTSPTPTIQLEVDVSSLQLTQGGTSTIDAAIVRSNMDGPVALAATGLPAGVTASFAPAVLVGPASEAQLTLAATAVATPGEFVLTIAASGNGVETQTETVSITVEVLGSYELVVDPPSMALPRTVATSSSVTVARAGGFAQPVTLSMSGAPVGVTASLQQATDGNSAAIALSASADATLGEATLTITGVTPGLGNETATLVIDVVPPPSIALGAVASTALTQGATANASITVARTSFSGDITLAVSGLPTGVTASFAPGTLTGDATTATLTFTATTTAAPGTSTITVSAIGTSVATSTTTLTLDVIVVGDYTLTADPEAVSMSPASTAQTTVAVSRTGGFAQDVELSVSGLPAGVTAAFNPSTATTSSTLTFTAESSAPLGVTEVTITGVTPGVSNRTMTVPLTVAQPGGITAVQLNFCASFLPVWIGYRNEGADWAQVTPDAAGEVTILATSKVIVANTTMSATNSPGGPVPRARTEFLFTTVAELQAVGGRLCTDDFDQPRDLSGTASGISSTQRAEIAMRQPWAIVDGSGDGSAAQNYTINAVPTGARDLVAVRGPTAVSFPTWAAEHVIIRRGINIPTGTAIPLIDFETTEAAPAASATYTVTGAAGGETTTGLLRFFTHAMDGGLPTQLRIWHGGSASPTSGSYVAVPGSLLASGDLQDFVWRADATGMWRGITDVFATATDRDLSFGPSLSAATFSQASATTGVRFRGQLPSQAEYAGLVRFVYTQTAGNVMAVEGSAQYFDGSPATWDITLPDMAGAPGWDNSWLLQAGLSTAQEAEAWSVAAYLMSHRRAIPDGTTARFAGSRVIGVMPTLRR